MIQPLYPSTATENGTSTKWASVPFHPMHIKGTPQGLIIPHHSSCINKLLFILYQGSNFSSSGGTEYERGDWITGGLHRAHVHASCQKGLFTERFLPKITDGNVELGLKMFCPCYYTGFRFEIIISLHAIKMGLLAHR